MGRTIIPSNTWKLAGRVTSKNVAINLPSNFSELMINLYNGLYVNMSFPITSLELSSSLKKYSVGVYHSASSNFSAIIDCTISKISCSYFAEQGTSKDPTLTVYYR